MSTVELIKWLDENVNTKDLTNYFNVWDMTLKRIMENQI